jgi:hypothetical protein
MDIIVTLVLAIIYFLPAINGYSRKHKSAGGIFLFNLLLGWTLLGWIVAAAWSAGGNVITPADGETPTVDTHVRCPDCKELVRRDARKCKHCGCILIPQ